MRSLEAPYKVLWMYLLCECDHAGIWDVELDVAQVRLGMKLEADKVVEKFGGAVLPIDGGSKWFLVGFIEFQYGTLNAANRVHASVLSLLEKYGIDPLMKVEKKDLISPLQGVKDKEKDKVTLEGKERAGEKFHAATVWPSFDDFWNLYDKKRGRPTAEREWAKVPQADREAIMAAVPVYTLATPKEFRKDPERYLKNKAWQDEVVNRTTDGKPSAYDQKRATLAHLFDQEQATRNASGGNGHPNADGL